MTRVRACRAVGHVPASSELYDRSRYVSALRLPSSDGTVPEALMLLRCSSVKLANEPRTLGITRSLFSIRLSFCNAVNVPKSDGSVVILFPASPRNVSLFS